MTAGPDLAALLPHHFAVLREGSGLSDEIIGERGYYSATTAAEIRRLGFSQSQAIAPALVIPLHDVNGEVTSYSLRPDKPRVLRSGKTAKYEQPKGARAIVDVPPRCRAGLRDPDITLYVTEGAKKADSLAARGACAVALSGVWNWRGTNELGGKMALPDWDGIALNGRRVRIAFDSDVTSKPEVAYALVRLKGFLEQRQAQVEVVYLPPTPSGDKQGVDDFFAAGAHLADLDAFASCELRRPDEAAEDTLPTVVTSGRHLRDIAQDCWKALVARNNGRPFVFERGRELCRVALDERGHATVSSATPEDVVFLMERLADFVRITKEGNREPDRIPGDVVADMMVAWSKPVPTLRGVVGTPVFAANGSIETVPGYQEQSRLYYQPIGEAVPPVPAQPSAEEVARARSLLLDEWLGDFPFVDAASRSNAVAIPVTAIARELIDGSTPLFAIDAPTPGTGKGYLAESAGLLVTGTPPAVMTEAHDEDEWRKRITAVLRDGAQFVLLDNLKAPLNSAHLAAVLTSDDWTDRILGKSETVRIPNRAAWVATGNNLRMDGDIVRRTVWVRLDARTDRPWERDGFQHDPFMPWVRANRHELVWALLVVVQNWLVSGRPKWGGKPMGTFESWAETIGGILAAAGIKGFLENREALYEYADGETEEWRAFTAAWWERFENRELKANDLLPLIGEGEHLSSLVGAGGREVTPQQLRIRLGRALQQRRDRLVGRFFIRRVGQDSHRKGTLYRLDIAESREEPQRLSANSPHDLGPVSDSNAESAESAESYFHPHAGRTDDATPQQDVARTHIERRPDHSPQTPHSPQTDSGEVPKPAESGAPRLSAGCTCLRCPANAGGRCNCGRYWRDDAKGLRCWHDKEAQS